jgi:uncharacterized hydrophobic protein (TIGR00271 family)
LISPLMGPILGIGLGIATHDRRLLPRAFRSFGIAVFISLITSVLYFLVTPIAQPTPELLARTSPTLLDVGIAFFGGVAGIVAGSRREATNAIPGVAIATALMPPLCTAGYGLATANWRYFLGAFYLFFLNAVFIALATFLIVRFLRFPRATFVDPAAERRVVRWIAALVLVTVIPSVVIFYDVIESLRRKSSAEQFVRRELENKGRSALNWTIAKEDSTFLLKVYLAGPPIDQAGSDSLDARLANYGLAHTRLRLVQLDLPQKASVDRDELLSLLRSAELREDITGAKNLTVEPPAAAPVDSIPAAAVEREMRFIFPTLADIRYARQPSADSLDTVAHHIFFVLQKEAAGRRQRHDALDRMQAFLRIRLPEDSVQVLEVTSLPPILTPVESVADTGSGRK